jgi:hypothetical protein
LFASALASRKGAGNAHHSEKELVIKRIALGLAIAAFAAPVAQAGVDQGIGVPRSSSTNAYEPFVTDFPSYANVGDASAYDLIEVVRSTPSAVPSDLIEVVRSTPRGAPSDKIEFVRTTQPRSTGEPQVVAVGFDWKDAGIGAGLALVLLGGGAVHATRRLGRAQTA